MSTRVMLADNKVITDAILLRHLDECGFLWMQPKIDGMRVYMGDDCIPRSRSGKEWKHKPLRAFAQALPSLRGFDGEVVPGHHYSADVFREAMSGIRAEDGTREFTFYVFDNTALHDRIYETRLDDICQWVAAKGEWHEGADYHARVIPCETRKVTSVDEVRALELAMIEAGWEGAMLRRPDRHYKFGRSTNLGGNLVKLKRYEDAEAIVVGYEPWERNDNEATQSPLGYQVRSAHQDGKVPIERLGALHVELATDRSIRFKIGVMAGVSHAERDRLWANRDSLIGRICKFKFQGYDGGYTAPRTPVFLNWRSASEF